MGLDSRHPLYSRFLPDWEQLRDCYEGERKIKSRGRLYLPATAGMIADGIDVPNSRGRNTYNAYLTRAVFPELVSQAIEAAIGVLHSKPPTIELPAQLEPLREMATLQKESLEMLLRHINEEQLLIGRLGLMLDVPTSDKVELPYIALYVGESGINWDDGPREGVSLEALNMVVLDESEYERNGFEWEYKKKHRVLVLGAMDENEAADAGRFYRAGVFEDEEFDESKLVEPTIGGKKLERIPFEFINAKDIVARPDKPPMLALSNLALAIYRGEADYRQALFMQGQDTLVVIGGSEDTMYRTGAGAQISPPIGGDAKYIGTSSAGLPEMRTALENDHARARRLAGELADETSKQRESGEALTVRVAAKTSTLRNIALAGAFGLQSLLRTAAEWRGANPEEVIVTPNLDFVGDTMEGGELVELMTSKTLGAPLSLETIHVRMQSRGMTERTFEEEIALIEKEKALELVPPATTNEDGPVDDPGGEGKGSDDEE